MAALLLRACTPDDADAVESLRVAGWKAAYRGLISDAFLDSMPVDVERRRIMAEHAEDVTESVAVCGDSTVGWV